MAGIRTWARALAADTTRAKDLAGDALSRALGEHVRPVLALLRRIRPVVATRRFALVTLAEDVHEVLRDHERFTVSRYAPRMTEITGPFILGEDATPIYARDHAALRAAIRADDVALIADETLAAARARIAASVDGRIDVVSQLADPVLDHVIATYFGTPGPDTPTQLRWARNLFEHIFLNVGDRPDVRDRALADAAQMRPHLDALIAARRAEIERGAGVPDDVLSRMLRHPAAEGGLHPIAIRHNLIGLITGWIPTVSKAFAQVVEELLRRPAELERAQHAAREGNTALVAAYVFEALRFRPQTWAVVRTASGEGVEIARGTPRATAVADGAMVLVATQSAMFDARAVRSPGAFRVDRPWSEYVHFGDGLHTCFGQQINRAHIPALATALLEQPHLGRVPGGEGRLRWRGPYPSGLTIALEP
jgi:cytochrome P450